MNAFKQMANSLAFKLGITLVLAEIVVLTITGLLYVDNFANEIDRRITGQVQLPGKLMQAGLLKFDSIADDKTMHDLVGEELINGLVVGTNQNVFYALKPDFLGKSAGDIPGIDTSLLKPDIVSAHTIQREQKIISVSPIFGADKRTLRFYVYVEASTTTAQEQKLGLIRLFFLGSSLTVVLTFVILFIAFNIEVFSKLRNLLAVLKQVENGDLTARVTGAITADEIGIVQQGVNSMIARLHEFVATLEQRVQDRTRELDIARKAAEAASNTKSVFLSNMSHELRTPLNMVIGYASSMLNMPQMYDNQMLPEVFRDDVQLIQDNGRYLVDLINDILDLSKIEAEKLTLNMQVVDLVNLFNGVLATSLGLVKEKPLQLTPDFPDELPFVWCDPLRVRQILLNVMSNAIKFTESGSVTLSAKVENDKVCIAVTDTGIGIPANALSTIFDRYEQIKSQVEGKHSGTGLGLDISQRLCHMHGSQLSVESVMGQGSTFTFELTHATPEQLESGKVSGSVVESSVKILKQTETAVIRQILVAEDNSDTRIQIRQALENCGHVVIETSDGTRLMSLALGVLPDIIISSIPLSGVDVWSALASLRDHAATADIPILVFGDPTNQQQAEQRGYTFLEKPLSPETLISCVNHLFDKQAIGA